MISFNQITNARVPFSKVEFDNSQAVGSGVSKMKTLIIGPKFSEATGPINKLVDAESVGFIAENYGYGSALHEMVSTFRVNNQSSELWVIALADAASGASAASIKIKPVLQQSRSKNHPFTVKIGGHRITVTLGKNELFSAFADKLIAEIDKLGNFSATKTKISLAENNPVSNAVAETIAENVPDITENETEEVVSEVTNFVAESTESLVSENSITITTKHQGEYANEILLEIVESLGFTEITDAGTTDLKSTLGQFSGGATNPSITPAITALGDEHFHSIISPYNDSANLKLAETHLENVFNANVQRESHYWTARHDSHTNLKAYTTGKTNSAHITIFGYHHSASSMWNWIAGISGTCIEALEIDPARPMKTLKVRGIEAPEPSRRFSFEKRDELLFSNISTTVYDNFGNVIIEMPVTCYSNSDDSSDDSLLSVNTLYTLFRLRQSFNAMWSRKYPRHKLANDGGMIRPGQAIMTPSLARSESIALAREWEEQGLIENVDLFIKELVVERDKKNRTRLNFLLKPDIVNQLLQIAAKFQFIL